MNPKQEVNLFRYGVAKHLFHGVKYQEEGKNKVKATVDMKSTSWPKMVKGLSKLKVVSDKNKTPYFVFGAFDHEMENGEHRRHNRYVIGHQGVCLDLDDDPNLKGLLGWVRKEKLNFALYSTHSHDPLGDKGERYRLVLPYSREIDPLDQPKVIYGIVQSLKDFGVVDMPIDRCSEVTSQPMFLHSCPKERQDEAVFEARTGAKFLNPDIYIEEVDELLMMGELSMAKTALPSETEKLDVGNRRPNYTRFIGKWAKEGDDKETVIDRLLAIDANSDVPLGQAEVIKTVHGVWETISRNSNQFGYKEILRQIDAVGDTEIGRKALFQIIGASNGRIPTEQMEDLIQAIADKSGGDISKAEIKRNIKIEALDKSEERNIDLRSIRDKFNVKLQGMLKPYVWIENGGYVLDTRTGDEISDEKFNRKMRRHMSLLFPDFFELFESKMVARGAGFAYATDNDLIKSVDNTRYCPGRKRLIKDEIHGARYYNTYVKPVFLGVDGDVTPMLKHFEYLIPCETSRNAVLDWFAYIAQNPGRKVMWMPVIYGGHGVGKSFLVKHFFGPILGKTNVQPVSSSQMSEKFNSFIVDNQLIVFEEVKFGRNKAEAMEVTNALKTLITEETVSVRKMRKDSFAAENLCNFIGFTNIDDAVYLEPGERRFLLIEGPKIAKTDVMHPEYNPQYYRNLAKWCETEEAQEAMFTYFTEERDLTDFNSNDRVNNDFTDKVKQEQMSWPLNTLAWLQQCDGSPLNSYNGAVAWSDLCKLVAAATPEGRDSDLASQLTSPRYSRAHKFLTRGLESLRFHKADVGNPRSLVKAGGRHGKKEVVWVSPAYIMERKSALLDTDKAREDMKEFKHNTFGYIKHLREGEVDENMMEELEEFGIDTLDDILD